ncbi:hypothetical protein DSO57_1022263 [Entomophthora muscae]|uniref:Uncharacterized protein n=1 Tax=Entomophthora muscae TaxID=34485 RepID=A0ACC2RHX8_9FUNG|nr:hypothetical protein DSO57_1022263 [Entomophthora muscae]
MNINWNTHHIDFTNQGKFFSVPINLDTSLPDYYLHAITTFPHTKGSLPAQIMNHDDVIPRDCKYNLKKVWLKVRELETGQGGDNWVYSHQPPEDLGVDVVSLKAPAK